MRRQRNPLAGQPRLQLCLPGGQQQPCLVRKPGTELDRGADGRRDAAGPLAACPAGTGDRLLEAFEGAVLGGQDDIELVVEELVEGRPRDPGAGDDVGDLQRRVAALGENRRRRRSGAARAGLR